MQAYLLVLPGTGLIFSDLVPHSHSLLQVTDEGENLGDSRRIHFNLVGCLTDDVKHMVVELLEFLNP